MNLYTDTIRKWAADERRVGTLADADGTGEVGLGEGEAGKRLAIRMALRVRDDHIETVRFQVFGCGFTIAACAAAAELSEGHSLSEASRIVPSWVDAVLDGLPPERDYCAELAVEALQAAIASARIDRRPVAATLRVNEDHLPRVTAANPLYRLLIDSPAPSGAPPKDRHLFACLLAVAASESPAPADCLGLSAGDLTDLLHCYFPAVTAVHLQSFREPAATPSPPLNPDLLKLLFSYLPRRGDGSTSLAALCLVRILTARSALPGHLWRAMGLFERQELTGAICRHLPALAEVNSQGMRWKRFFFKQLCERQGGTLCKTPDCGVCSDYARCFEQGEGGG